MKIRLPRKLASTSTTPDPSSLTTSTTSTKIRSGMRIVGAISANMPVTTSRPLHTVHSLLPQLPKPDPPLLLLQGDELHVSPQGVARSCYQLNGSASSWTVEESYDLYASKKSFVITTPDHTSFTIDIQEIDTRRAGTGGTTWEASIAMALYFACHPERLRGQVIELGSGVGLGGILLDHLVSTNRQHSSITLTDGNSQVLKQCRSNIARQGQFCSSLKTKILNWNDRLTSDISHYDTVLACDCAYRSQDVTGLATTLKLLLSQRDSQIHLFGPYNRTAYHQVIQWLEKDEDLDVRVEWIELERFRLNVTTAQENWYEGVGTMNPADPSRYGMESLSEELEHSSRSTTKFLHVTASYNKKQFEGCDDYVPGPKSFSLSDID